MLTVDPNERPDAATCSRHPWFAEMEGKQHSEMSQDPAITQQILKNLKAFKGQSELRRAALNIFVKMCRPKEYDQIAEAFRNFDKDCSGTIEVDELRKILKSNNF